MYWFSFYQPCTYAYLNTKYPTWMLDWLFCFTSMSCFIFLGGLRIHCLNCLYGLILCLVYNLLLFSHLMLYTTCFCILFKDLLPFFIGTLHFWTTLFVVGFFLLLFNLRGWLFFELVGLSSSWASIGLTCLSSLLDVSIENNVFFSHFKGFLFQPSFLQC
jgi:hypothetical protein